MRDASMRLAILSQVSLILEKSLEIEGLFVRGRWLSLSIIFCSLIQIHNCCATKFTDAGNEHSKVLEQTDRRSSNLLSVVKNRRPISRGKDFNAAIDSLNEIRGIMVLVYDMLRKMQLHAIKYNYMNTLKLQHLPESTITRTDEESLWFVISKRTFSHIFNKGLHVTANRRGRHP